MQLVLLSALLLIKIALVRPCEPDFGTDYPGCDIKQKHDVHSWKECSRICSYTTNCKYWTWAHADSTVSPLTCWLKHSKCPIKLSSNLVSGDTNCPTKSLSSLKSSCLQNMDWIFLDVIWRACKILKIGVNVACSAYLRKVVNNGRGLTKDLHGLHITVGSKTRSALVNRYHTLFLAMF